MENKCPICDENQIIDNSDRILIKADGTKIPILKTVKRIKINGEEKLLESFIDITEKKHFEEFLKLSLQNFGTFFETIDDMIFIANKQGEVFYTNSTVVKKLGYSTEELFGMHILEVHQKEKRKEAEEIFADMFNGKRNICPLPLQSKDGKIIPVETRIWFGTWDGKECVFGISKDLSKEQEVLQKFDKMFHSNPALMAVSSLPERKYTEVNDAFLKTTGYTKEEVIGKTAIDLGLAFEVEKFQDVSKALSKKGFIHNIELKIKTKSGEILDGLFSGEIIESQNKQYFLTVMIDITERKKAEEELQKSSTELKNKNIQLDLTLSQVKSATNAKSEFLANMSHEIRTPLNGIIGFTELLLETYLDESQKEYTNIINTSGKTLLTIINDILDFSKIEAGKMELEVVKTDILKLAKDCLEIIKYQANKKRIELLFNISQKLPNIIETDSLRLKQILLNLLSNAIKFTEKGEVELKINFVPINEKKGILKFYVRDTGIGIKESEKEKLFKAFSQADSSITRKFGGTGLGLIISNFFVEKMGGKIEFESEYTKGSVFKFEITAFYENKENTKEEIKIVEKIKTDYKYNILVAEDVKVNMTLIKILISKIVPNSTVIEAFNGIEAFDKFKQNNIDLVLMDVQMPEMDGLESTKLIREYEKGKNIHIPIIAATAGVLKEEKDKCIFAGMDDFLAKPVRMETLSKIIEQYLINNNINDTKEKKDDILSFDK